jgi:hypothetical protein
MPAIGVFLLGVWLVCGNALADTYRLRDEQPEAGSRIRPDAAIWALPFDKTYAELTDAQREILRLAYIDMPPEDEPPYPLNGMKPFMRQISKAQKSLRVRGDLFAVATVDESGDVRKVDFFEAPSEQMAKAVGIVLIKTKFKPGVCGGVPCVMEYPFQMRFEVK